VDDVGAEVGQQLGDLCPGERVRYVENAQSTKSRAHLARRVDTSSVLHRRLPASQTGYPRALDIIVLPSRQARALRVVASVTQHTLGCRENAFL
jgi:hypothetical protein